MDTWDMFKLSVKIKRINLPIGGKLETLYYLSFAEYDIPKVIK